MRLRPTFCFLFCLTALAAQAAQNPGAAEFRKEVRPILEKYCFDCHGDGEKKGEVAFDEFNPDLPPAESRALWWRALKNVRSGMMPPAKKAQPTKEERARLEQWIKRAAFEMNPQQPDPGRVTLRRLNRVEYRHTIHDLLGVEYDTAAEFPADDTGYGFDNIGDVLTLPPMLLEKYLLAANAIITEAVPVVEKVAPEQYIGGQQFHPGGNGGGGGRSLSYYQAASVTNTLRIEHAGKYQLGLDLMILEKYVDDVFDYNKCRVIFRADGRELLRQDFSWEGGKPFHFGYDLEFAAGDHSLTFEIQPRTPGEKQTRTLSMQLRSVTLRGPQAEEFWVVPKNHGKFFPKEIPATASGRRDYARELLGDYARRAFRRPVEKETLDRLVALAESVYHQPGKTFEAGVAQAMVAVLASPRFLFHAEGLAAARKDQLYPFVDEYALASRLSYFLWSSMPDEELFRLAGAGKLRENLSAQFKRMLADDRSAAFVRNFTGQWLQARDIETVPIEARVVLARERKFDPESDRRRKRFRELNDKSDLEITPAEKAELAEIRETFKKTFQRPARADLNGEIRSAMRQETEKSFDYVLREDRSVLELLDADYTFLNEPLANYYGIPNVSGHEMRRVPLPAGSPRGGILTQGTVLGVTSNPTRTSPVKRGAFILDNILGAPSPPPPPNIPPLEDAAKDIKDHPPSLRETLARHRADPLCSSCHSRLDPPGLALENFNALGLWRDQEFEQPIDVTGKLFTGEDFKSVKELKHLLVSNHAQQFYRTLTEKMLTYALGRGLEYYDVATVDQIVERLEQAGGKPSALLLGIVESTPFQKTRSQATRTASAQPPINTALQHAARAGFQNDSSSVSTGGVKDVSPWREPWVNGSDSQAPAGAKEIHTSTPNTEVRGARPPRAMPGAPSRTASAAWRGHEPWEPFYAREVFCAGAENGARGGRAPHSILESGLNGASVAPAGASASLASTHGSRRGLSSDAAPQLEPIFETRSNERTFATDNPTNGKGKL